MIITPVLFPDSFLQIVIVNIKIQECSVYYMDIFYSILLTSNLENIFPPFESFHCISEGEQRKQTNKQIFHWISDLFP